MDPVPACGRQGFLVSNNDFIPLPGKSDLMIKRILLLTMALMAVQTNLVAQDVISRLIGASPFQDSLWAVDTTNMSITYRIMPNPSAGGSITGMNGIAKHPNTGDIYVVIKQTGVSGRVLGTLNTQLNLVNIIGNLGDNFASITFCGDSLFGVTGDGATVPETVYLINTADASKTVYRALGNGADGEVICYNPTDDMIYHWSGNGTVVFEKFSPDNAALPVTSIPIVGTTNGETFGSVYIGNNNFLTSNIASGFNHWNANGTVTGPTGNMPDDLRGLAFITCNREVSGTNNFCIGDSTLLSMSSAFSYQWFKNGVEISGETSQTYYASAAGIYNCRVHDVCGTDTVSTSFAVQQNPLPIVNVSGSAIYCTGTPVTLTGSSGGSSQWYLNGAPISGETSNTLSASAPGVYNMTKTNMNGCTDSAATGITVVEFALPVVTLSSPAASVCNNGDVVELTESPAGGTFTGSAGNQFDPTASLPGMDTVIYTYTDANGCSSEDTVIIEVFEVVAASIDAIADQCSNGDPVNLNGIPAGGTFVPSGTVDPAAIGVGVHVYEYSYVDVNGCSDTTSINVTVVPPPSVIVGGPDTDLCVYDGPVFLTALPAGGVYSGPGVTGNSFDPSGLSVGNSTVEYTYTDASTGCTNIASVVMTIDSCLSVNETVLAERVVFPNPASADVTIDLGTPVHAVLTLTDMTGKRVTVPVFQESQFVHINVSQLSNGAYWLVVQTTDGQSRQKIVVLH
jgi:hypothetical protein